MKNAGKLILVLSTLVLVSAAFAVFAPAPAQDGTECFTVLVGRLASADGAVMVAHNEDDRGDIIVNLRKIQARDYGGPQQVALGKGAIAETSGRTNGFLWIEATTQEFADSFVNDHGVVITSDSCPSRATADDLTDGGIGWMLRRLVAEQAVSARDGVRLAGALIEKYGYNASGRTYSIADKYEAWMVAVLKGRHWYAERVPDDEVAVIPNRFTIRHIRPGDANHFLGSPDIVEYAAKNGWYDEAKDGPFDFAKAFNRPTDREPAADGNSLRQWRGLCLVTGKFQPLGRDCPFSAKPGTKMTAEALMAVLRDHYEGTPYDATEGYKTGTPNRTKFRTICTASTINAFVVSPQAPGPWPLGSAIWLAMGKPDTTIFLPLYYAVEALPPGAGFGPNQHDYQAMAKLHFEDAEIKAAKGELLNTKVLALEKAAEASYGPMHELLVKGLFPTEKGFLKDRPGFEKDFAALYRKDPKAALKKLDDYIAGAFAKVSDLTEKLLKMLPNRP
jgi:dipeptidase